MYTGVVTPSQITDKNLNPHGLCVCGIVDMDDRTGLVPRQSQN